MPPELLLQVAQRARRLDRMTNRAKARFFLKVDLRLSHSTNNERVFMPRRGDGLAAPG